MLFLVEQSASRSIHLTLMITLEMEQEKHSVIRINQGEITDRFE